MASFDYKEFILNHPAKTILGLGNSEQEIRDNSFRFVNTVAIDLRKLGNTEVRVYEKTSGSNSFGYASDILVIGIRLFDIVGSSDTPTASVVYNDAGLGDTTRFKIPDPSIYVGSAPIPNPNPNPIPVPIPTPIPIPPNDLPTYFGWLEETSKLRDLYFKTYNREPSERDCGHWGWRRFVELWKFEDMLKDI